MDRVLCGPHRTSRPRAGGSGSGWVGCREAGQDDAKKLLELMKAEQEGPEAMGMGWVGDIVRIKVE